MTKTTTPHVSYVLILSSALEFILVEIVSGLKCLTRGHEPDRIPAKGVKTCITGLNSNTLYDV